QYDPLGWVTGLSYGSDTAWMANVFQSQDDLPLRAVGFYTASTVNNYEIYIYLNTAPRVAINGDPVATKSGVINSPGFFTIELDNPVALTDDQYFSVVVRLQTVGYEYPIPIEGYIGGYSSGATTNPGMCLVSSNGTGWTVLTDAGLNYDICLKAFIGPDPLYPPINLHLTPLENNFIFFKEKINRLTWAANPANTTQITGYNIYRKAASQSTYSLLGTVGASRFIYDDRGLKNPTFYSYQVTTIDVYGRESDPVTIYAVTLTPRNVKAKPSRTKMAPTSLSN
ncbi:MAG: lectin like domain-containing protein, partial [Acidobacteriota bacterium]|nr:lectin like domain-containing protein [Acidobacteriota bacterium]